MKIKIYFLTLLISGFAFGQTGTMVTGSLKSGGVTRTYQIYVPLKYQTLNVPVPVVFNVHGLTGTYTSQDVAEDFRKIADTANFLIVLPQGLSSSSSGFPATGWDVWNTVASGQADRDFIIDLLDKVETNYKVDINRVYTAGFSQGAYMSYNLGCLNSNRFAAVSSTSGSMVQAYIDACSPTHPTPVIEIHGTNDPLVSYNGNANALATDSIVKFWIKYNHCNLTPSLVAKLPDIADSATVDTSTVVHYVYSGGTKGATVEFYKVLNGGHNIPSLAPVPTEYGVGHINQDFTAAKEIWRFFSKYRLDSLGVVAIMGNFVDAINGPESNNNSVSIYPNPSNGTFTVSVENYENTNLQLLNLLGVVVYEGKLSNNHTNIDLAGISKGIYFYKIANKNAVVKSGKLIIE